jgi:CRISPR-associated protein Csh1
VLEEFWNKLVFFRENTIVNGKDAFNSINCIFKFPDYFIEKNNIYQSWYENYLSKKLFKTEPLNDKGYPVRFCSVCNNKSETWLPNAFHNLDSKKPFTLHLDRKTDHNLAVCSDCSMKIYEFQELFLNKKKISIFPLFVTEELRREEITLLQTNRTKVTFSNIINKVFQQTPNDVFDFFLVIYNQDLGFLNFDYISGFTLNYNGKTIFEIEQQINELFFEYKLQQNYFSKKVDTKNAYLDNLIYRYRTQVFDFVYRAKDSLNSNDISDMYFQTLQRRLRDCYNKDKEAFAIANLNKLKLNFLELNKALGGNFMQTVKRIKESGKVTDLESLSYYIGQMVYYLLNQSKKGQKTHAMVEPFINVTNFKTLGIKLEETFNAYKHELSLNWDKLNQKFSEIWGFLYDNQNQEFNRDLKILFYAGYFDKNIFFQTTKNKEIKEM